MGSNGRVGWGEGEGEGGKEVEEGEKRKEEGEGRGGARRGGGTRGGERGRGTGEEGELCITEGSDPPEKAEGRWTGKHFRERSPKEK